MSANEKTVKLRESVKDIVRNFHYKFKFSNYTSGKIIITISWWEPSIFQSETIFAIKYIKRFLLKRHIVPVFDIQTNASNVTPDFARKLSDLGIELSLVSFHTHDRDIFNELIGVDYNMYFHKVIEWIHNLYVAWIRVECNVIINKINKDSFYDTIVFLERTFPFIQVFCIWFFQPHGEADKNFDNLYVDYKEIQTVYNASISYIQQRWKTIWSHYVWPPACYLENLEVSLEISENMDFRKSHNFTGQHLINDINDRNKQQVPECWKCMYKNVCSGLWKEYIGIQKVEPLFYEVDSSGKFHLGRNYYKLLSQDVDLSRIRLSGVLQIIIPTSIGSKISIYNLIHTATNKWFYQVTLLLDSCFELDKDIFHTGVSNIQVDIDSIDTVFVWEMVDFSKKNGPQFRIDLDIFSTKTSIWQEWKKYLDTDFVRIHYSDTI